MGCIKTEGISCCLGFQSQNLVLAEKYINFYVRVLVDDDSLSNLMDIKLLNSHIFENIYSEMNNSDNLTVAFFIIFSILGFTSFMSFKTIDKFYVLQND